MRAIANLAFAVALALTVAIAAFWSFAWQPALGEHLSSKAIAQTYNAAAAGQPAKLVVMGDLGKALAAYTDDKPEIVTARDQIVSALKRPERVFAIAPQSELCAIHREMANRPYVVLDERNHRSLLFSNRLDGMVDRNPLRSLVVHAEPEGIATRPKGRVVWDNKIELIGWSLPERIENGESFDVITYFKVLAPVGGTWTMLMHFDGPMRLRDGDHKPINDRCPTSNWMPGDYIIDRHTIHTTSGSYPFGRYELWIGFFTGSAPNFRNMQVSAAPGEMRDTVDRIKIAAIVLD